MVQSSARAHDAAPGPEKGPAARTSAAVPSAGLLRLQRAAGNAAVTQHVQRYAVGVPATADHSTLMDWMTSSNPYAPDEAAKTDAKFKYDVAWVATGEPGSWTVTPSSTATVKVVKTVDMPVWAAKDPKLQAAWAAGVTALRAHEKLHEDLANTWRATLEGRLRAFTTTSSADTKAGAGAEANTALGADWLTWLDEHQAEQDKLDPYHVVVTDPYPRAAPPAPAPAPDAESGEGE